MLEQSLLNKQTNLQPLFFFLFLQHFKSLPQISSTVWWKLCHNKKQITSSCSDFIPHIKSYLNSCQVNSATALMTLNLLQLWLKFGRFGSFVCWRIDLGMSPYFYSFSTMNKKIVMATRRSNGKYFIIAPVCRNYVDNTFILWPRHDEASTNQEKANQLTTKWQRKRVLSESQRQSSVQQT